MTDATHPAFRLIVVAPTKAHADQYLADERPELDPKKVILVLASTIDDFEKRRGYIWKQHDELVVLPGLDLDLDDRRRICQALLMIRDPGAGIGPTIDLLQVSGLYEPAVT